MPGARMAAATRCYPVLRDRTSSCHAWAAPLCYFGCVLDLLVLPHTARRGEPVLCQQVQASVESVGEIIITVLTPRALASLQPPPEAHLILGDANHARCRALVTAPVTLSVREYQLWQ